MDTLTWHAEFLIDRQRVEGTDQWWLSPGEFSQWVTIKGPNGAAKATDLYTQKLMQSLDSIEVFLKGLSFSTSDSDGMVLWLLQGRVDSASKSSPEWQLRRYGIRPKKDSG